MTFDFFSFLQSFFRPMSTSMASKSDDVHRNSFPASPFLPSTDGIGISDYMSLLKATATQTQEGRAELSKYMVIKLEHIKEKKNVEHEYVIATVKYNEMEVRLSIERTQGAELPKNYQHQESPTAISNSKIMTMSSVPRSSQDSLFRPTSAKDMIRIIEHQTSHRSSHFVLNTFYPRPGALPLLQLAVIIKTVHEVEERYAPFRAQCYWFAMLVMGAAMVHGGRWQIQSSERGRGKTTQELPPVASTSDLNHIPISPPPPPDVEEAPLIEGGVGKRGWIPVVAVEPKDIQNIAKEAEKLYKRTLEDWEATRDSIAREILGDAAKKIKELEDEIKRMGQLLSQQQPESSRH